MPHDDLPECIKPTPNMGDLVAQNYQKLHEKVGAILQTRNPDAINEFMSDLVCHLLEQEDTHYDATRGSFLTWVSTVAKRLWLRSLRDRARTAQWYQPSHEHLVSIRNRLTRKPAETFPDLLVHPTIEALLPLIGSRMDRTKLLAQLRQCLLNVNGGPLDHRTWRIAVEVIEQETAVLNAPAPVVLEEIPEAGSETLENEPIQQMQCLLNWLETEELALPDSAAVYFLKHFHEGLDFYIFDPLRKRLQQRYPAMQILDERPAHALGWGTISRIVYGDHAPTHKSSNTYKRKSDVHWKQWRQLFCGHDQASV